MANATLVTSLALAVAAEELLEVDGVDALVIGIDPASGPDMSVPVFPREVDIRPAKHHHLINGHPRSFRKK